MAKISPSGDYRQLRSFQSATLIYDATCWFCERFLDPRSRSSDRMVQAARSARLNIAEGSRAAASSKTELRRLNAARSSFEELLLDFEDYLRHRRLSRWAAESAESLSVRPVAKTGPSGSHDRPEVPGTSHYSDWLESPDPAARANALICLIHEAAYLLDRQIESLEKPCVAEAGDSEQPTTARIAERSRKKEEQPAGSDRTNPPERAKAPTCPKCSKPMALRTAQKGKRAGRQFWGCTGYPDCKAVAEI